MSLAWRNTLAAATRIIPINMTSNQVATLVRQCFGFEPTADQAKAIDVFSKFATDRSAHPLMILRGSAGTGKTSVAGAIVKAMRKLGHRTVLLAPTGRAAKVIGVNAGHEAWTIHRRIYRQTRLGGPFSLAPNMSRDTLFIVDEASMIANDGLRQAVFGTGRLLDDLVSYVYSGQNCSVMLVGDKAQLPPVGEEESPALSPSFMAGYGLQVYCADLDEVLRQSRQSGILFNATAIRNMITHDEATRMPKVRFGGFADIVMVPGDELIETLATSYAEVGSDETMVVTRSNKRANVYNQGIRNTVLMREEQLVPGDMVMVVKNNYYWTEMEITRMLKEARASAAGGTAIPAESLAEVSRIPSFIANGDRAAVVSVRNQRQLYGFNFVDLWLRFPDYDGYELKATVITDSLSTEAPALTKEQNDELFDRVMEDYADIRTKPERIKRLKQDPYFNAMQIKYAYAVTCHKAQGGQWSHVYVDQGYMTDEMLSPDYIHWLYTAFTRATDKLFLVNWPKAQTIAEENGG